MRSAVLFFCHGARDPGWRVPFDDIVVRFAAARPDVPVALAFLELMEPGFEPALASLVEAGAQRVDVVPLFLAPGGHSRRDLPALVAAARTRWPALEIRTAPTIAESEAMRAAIVASAIAGLGPASP